MSGLILDPKTALSDQQIETHTEAWPRITKYEKLPSPDNNPVLDPLTPSIKESFSMDNLPTSDAKVIQQTCR